MRFYWCYRKWQSDNDNNKDDEDSVSPIKLLCHGPALYAMFHIVLYFLFIVAGGVYLEMGHKNNPFVQTAVYLWISLLGISFIWLIISDNDSTGVAAVDAETMPDEDANICCPCPTCEKSEKLKCCHSPLCEKYVKHYGRPFYIILPHFCILFISFYLFLREEWAPALFIFMVFLTPFLVLSSFYVNLELRRFGGNVLAMYLQFLDFTTDIAIVWIWISIGDYYWAVLQILHS
jgi:hypothetical protein